MTLKPLKDIIPTIEESPDSDGYWEVYKDAEDKVIKKVWHANKVVKRDAFEEGLDNIINNKEENMASLEDIYKEDKVNRKDKSRFVKLDSGESFIGEFVGVEKTTGQFGEVNSFTFIVDGNEKVWNTKSFKVLESMVKVGVKEGSKVKITKEGQGFKTTYLVELVK